MTLLFCFFVLLCYLSLLRLFCFVLLMIRSWDDIVICNFSASFYPTDIWPSLTSGRVVQHTSLSLLLIIPIHFSSLHSMLFLPLPLRPSCNHFLRLPLHSPRSKTINPSFLLCGNCLFVSVRDAASGEIVCRELTLHAISYNNANRVLPYLARYSGEY